MRRICGHGREAGVYFDAVAVITMLVLLGQVLELAHAAGPAVRSARCSFEALMPRYWTFAQFAGSDCLGIHQSAESDCH